MKPLLKLITLGIAAGWTATAGTEAADVWDIATARPGDAVDQTALSVMTYNVNGMPWPFAIGRSAAFAKIETRLNALRQQNAQPHVIVLQEAFTDQAKQIAIRSGYHFVANGPSSDKSGIRPPNRDDISFAAAASFFKGETSGKLLDSGLQIASDYPILSVRSEAFPNFACAGYDCLANKGVLMVTLAVPGSSTPVTVVTTHLNSKRASGVSQERSLYAYHRQVAALDAFLAVNRDPDQPMIVAGDFNASNIARRTLLVEQGANGWSAGRDLPVQSALQNCIADAARRGRKPDDLAKYVVDRGRDWQFYAAGLGNSIQAAGLLIPFGRERDGTMLSDHVGYNIVYRLKPTA
jgi:endonuclease/exonuclease/phosphatase family metal-dependent hydrolase